MAARLLRLWVRMLTGVWMSVCCECWVLSGRGLCDGPITRPEESNRLLFVVVCDQETSWMRRPWPTEWLSRQNTQKNNKQTNIKPIREFSALQEVLNKFSYVVLPEHVDMFATRAQSILQSSISSYSEHLCWVHMLFGTVLKYPSRCSRPYVHSVSNKTYINLLAPEFYI